jgi:hypothetical protein
MTKVLNRSSSSATGRLQTRCTKSVGPAIGILRDTPAPEGSNGPLWHLENRRRRTWGRSWRLRRAPRGRSRHARALFAKYRSDQSRPAVSPWSVLRSRRMMMRRPSAFTETDVKRAIRGAMAAGVTPGRVVLTKDGTITVEFATDGTPGGTAAPAAVTGVNLWDELLGANPSS